LGDFVGGRFGHLMYWWAIWSFYVLVGDFSLGELGVADFSLGDFALGDLSCSPLSLHGKGLIQVTSAPTTKPAQLNSPTVNEGRGQLNKSAEWSRK